MSDQDVATNPLVDQPIGMEEYADGNAQAIEMMTKIFSFSFASDFERAYKKESFNSLVVDEQNPHGFQRSTLMHCTILTNFYYASSDQDHDFQITSFELSFARQNMKNFILDDEKAKIGMFNLRYSHLLIIAPKNYISTAWVGKVLALHEEGFSFEIKDHNPQNNSFLKKLDGQKLEGICKAEDILTAKFRLVESDSFTFYARKDGIRYSLQYSYIPFDALSLGNK